MRWFAVLLLAPLVALADGRVLSERAQERVPQLEGRTVDGCTIVRVRTNPAEIVLDVVVGDARESVRLVPPGTEGAQPAGAFAVRAPPTLCPVAVLAGAVESAVGGEVWTGTFAAPMSAARRAVVPETTPVRKLAGSLLLGLLVAWALVTLARARPAVR